MIRKVGGEGLLRLLQTRLCLGHLLAVVVDSGLVAGRLGGVDLSLVLGDERLGGAGGDCRVRGGDDDVEDLGPGVDEANHVGEVVADLVVERTLGSSEQGIQPGDCRETGGLRVGVRRKVGAEWTARPHGHGEGAGGEELLDGVLLERGRVHSLSAGGALARDRGVDPEAGGGCVAVGLDQLVAAGHQHADHDRDDGQKAMTVERLQKSHLLPSLGQIDAVGNRYNLSGAPQCPRRAGRPTQERLGQSGTSRATLLAYQSGRARR